VTVTRQETNIHVTLSTNEAGFGASLAPRSLRRVGYERGVPRKTGVELRLQDRLEVNFSLLIGATSTEVTGRGTSALVGIRDVIARTGDPGEDGH
jgi:hypothetical protein